MHVFFSAICGTAIGPLALIAQAAGHTVSGSDKKASDYMEYLHKQGIKNAYVGQSYEAIAAIHAKKPIDWYVYSSAVAIEQPNHPEFLFCREHGIKMSKRDEFLTNLIADHHLKLIAAAGTHGKTTTTAMMVWIFKELGLPLSYSVGAKLPFSEMGKFDAASHHFVYECDEFDRNFLAFKPYVSLLTGIDWDHPDIYPTREEYYQAFRQFIDQSEFTVMWQSDARRLGMQQDDRVHILNDDDPAIQRLQLQGLVNRRNAWLVIQGIAQALDMRTSVDTLIDIMQRFPGLSRRFEKLSDNLYTDYAHTPEKIRGALQTAQEVASSKIVVVYEGLHNTRQHFIKDELPHLFDCADQLYVVPSYLAREDQQLPLLSPDEIAALTAHSKSRGIALNDELWQIITEHTKNNDLVLCLSAGGGGSLDEWLRLQLAARTQ